MRFMLTGAGKTIGRHRNLAHDKTQHILIIDRYRSKLLRSHLQIQDLNLDTSSSRICRQLERLDRLF